MPACNRVALEDVLYHYRDYRLTALFEEGLHLAHGLIIDQAVSLNRSRYLFGVQTLYPMHLNSGLLFLDDYLSIAHKGVKLKGKSSKHHGQDL